MREIDPNEVYSRALSRAGKEGLDENPMPLTRAQRASRFALVLAAIGMFKVSAAAFFVGTLLTLFALSSSTERADAHVFLGIGPAFLLGGLVSGVLALRAWRSRRPRARAAT